MAFHAGASRQGRTTASSVQGLLRDTTYSAGSSWERFSSTCVSRGGTYTMSRGSSVSSCSRRSPTSHAASRRACTPRSHSSRGSGAATGRPAGRGTRPCKSRARRPSTGRPPEPPTTPAGRRDQRPGLMTSIASESTPVRACANLDLQRRLRGRLVVDLQRRVPQAVALDQLLLERSPQLWQRARHPRRRARTATGSPT